MKISAWPEYYAAFRLQADKHRLPNLMNGLVNPRRALQIVVLILALPAAFVAEYYIVELVGPLARARGLDPVRVKS